MNIEKKNSRIIVIYLYMGVFLNLLSLILNDKQISNIGYAITIFLIIYTLIINNFYVSKKLLWILVISLIYMTINLLVVSYKYFVLVEIFSILTSCFLPLYIIILGKVKYKYLLEFWFKIAKMLTLFFPIYIILYSKSFIGYGDIGVYSHTNTLIIIYYLFIIKEVKLSTIIFLIVNISMGFIIGSRMALISSIITSTAMILFLPQKRKFKHYFGIILFSVLALVVVLNIKDIIYFIYSITTKYGIRSRNLILFIEQLEGASFEEFSSGRAEIYKIVSEYISNRSGLPGGLAVPRYLTDGTYYYSHNVFLDFTLVFGIIGTIVFFIWYIYKNFKFFKLKQTDYYRFSLYFILTISFWLQSITGAYFLQNKFFLVSISILILFNNEYLDFSCLENKI